MLMMNSSKNYSLTINDIRVMRHCKDVWRRVDQYQNPARIAALTRKGVIYCRYLEKEPFTPIEYKLTDSGHVLLRKYKHRLQS